MTRLLLVSMAMALATPALGIPGAEGADDTGNGEDFPDEWDPTAPGADDDEPVNQIVNGRLAEDGEFPEVVHLRSGGGCTGSVIDPAGYWVLTAAHCLDEDTPQDGVVVTVGNSESEPEQQVRSARWIRNDNWDDNGIASQGKDIAVIELSEPLEVFPMALNEAPMDASWLGLEVTITGFGITSSNRNDSGIKRVAQTEIAAIGDLNFPDNSDYADQYFEYNGSQSTCQGDSGGPTVANVGTGYVQIGITSWGGVPCGSSESGNIRVDKYIGWLTARGVPFTTAAGSPPSFVCSNRLNEEDESASSIGIVPFDIRCQVVYGNRDELTTVEWQWGDGTTSEGLDVVHTYERAGNFTVVMTARGDRDGEEWSHSVPRNGLVTACDVPVAGFEVEPIEGLTWQIANKTDVSTYGCITDLVWEVYDESGELVEEYGGWEPEITFAEPGDYRIVQNVGGFAGADAAEVSVKVRRRAGACDSTGGTGPLAAFGLLLGAAFLRRRRS